MEHAAPKHVWRKLSGLAAAIDLDVVHAEAVKVNRPQPGTLLGSGTVEHFADLIRQAEEDGHPIDLVVMDHALSPVQQRNLERGLEAKVIDRTGLILEIFGARARTREGQLAGRTGGAQLPAFTPCPVVDPLGTAARRLRLPRRSR